MPRNPVNESKAVAARASTVSVRTTVPAHVCDQIGIEAGDTLVWKLDKIRGRWVAVMGKAGA